MLYFYNANFLVLFRGNVYVVALILLTIYRPKQFWGPGPKGEGALCIFSVDQCSVIWYKSRSKT